MTEQELDEPSSSESSMRSGLGEEFVAQYFQSLRDEIHLRLREHTRLVWIKVVVLGGMITFLMSEFLPNRQPALLYLLWMLPLLGVVFDVLIAGNLEAINNISKYNNEHIEGKAFDAESFPDDFSLWEEEVARSENEWVNYPLPAVGAIWFLTFSSWIFITFIRIQLTPDLGVLGVLMDVVFGIITFLATLGAGFSFYAASAK